MTDVKNPGTGAIPSGSNPEVQITSVPHSGVHGYELPVDLGTIPPTLREIQRSNFPDTGEQPVVDEAAEHQAWMQEETQHLIAKENADREAKRDSKERLTPAQKARRVIAAVALGAAGITTAVVGVNWANSQNGIDEGDNPGDTPPVAEQPIDQGPVTPENPGTITTISDGGEFVSGENQFDISNEQYKEIVESFRINLPADATDAQVSSAIIEKLNLYLTAGQTVDAYNAHAGYKSPDGVHEGWNAWSLDVYSSAIVDAMGIQPEVFDNIKGIKEDTNGIAIYAKTNGEGNYKVTVSYDLAEGSTHATTNPIGYEMLGSLSFSGNRESIPSFNDDPRAYGATPSVNEGVVMLATYSTSNDWNLAALHK